MALTPEQIGRISRPYGESSIQGFDHILAFAQAIEAEVRKQDDALILQLVEAMEVATTPLAADRQEVLRAVTAGRARLEGKP
ncbi:MAG TPA: hypothetical protein PLN67_19825 [Acidovorax defluvii]|nr:hypothetical protein [Acidovorax defluvii]HQT19631.1 hypothetical protein [Acidovorax defluvii]